MKFFSNPHRAVQGAVPGTQPLFNNSLLAFALFLLCFFSFGHPVMAQSVHWQNEGGFLIGYQFSTAEDTIAANEQFSIKLYLEVLDPDVCGGATFSLVIDDRANPMVNPLSVPNPNWLDAAGVLGTRYTETSGSDTVTCSVWHFEETLVSGSGWVLTADFEVGDTALPVVEIMAYYGGNLIMDENLDMKTKFAGSPKPVPDLTLFPNPCREELSLSIPLPKDWTVEVRDLNGKVYPAGIEAVGQAIRVERLAPGMYFLMVYDERKARRKTLKFMRQ